MDLAALDEELAARVVAAEEAIYARPDDPMTNWSADDLRDAFVAADLNTGMELQVESSDLPVNADLLARWFTSSGTAGQARPSYADHLRALLTAEELARVADLFRQQLLNRTVAWQTTTAFVMARARQE